jgi:hypothetical protein
MTMMLGPSKAVLSGVIAAPAMGGDAHAEPADEPAPATSEASTPDPESAVAGQAPAPAQANGAKTKGKAPTA